MGSRGSLSERRFLRETELALVNAPFVEDGWTTAIDMVARATWSRGANLVCLGGSVPSLNLISGFDQDEVDQHFDDPDLWGVQNWRVGAVSQPFEIQHDLHYRAYRERVGTGAYCAIADQLDMPFGCQTLFSKDRSGFVGLAIMRGRRDGPSDPAMVDRFGLLSGVVARAIRAEMAMAGDGIRISLGRIDESSEAIVLLNRHGWACGMSDLAAAYLECGMPLRLNGARLGASSPNDAARLDQLLRFMLHPDTGREGGTVTLALADMAGTGWRLHVTALPASGLSLGFDACLAVRIERRERPGVA